MGKGQAVRSRARRWSESEKQRPGRTCVLLLLVVVVVLLLRAVVVVVLPLLAMIGVLTPIARPCRCLLSQMSPRRAHAVSPLAVIPRAGHSRVCPNVRGDHLGQARGHRKRRIVHVVGATSRGLLTSAATTSPSTCRRRRAAISRRGLSMPTQMISFRAELSGRLHLLLEVVAEVVAGPPAARGAPPKGLPLLRPEQPISLTLRRNSAANLRRSRGGLRPGSRGRKGGSSGRGSSSIGGGSGNGRTGDRKGDGEVGSGGGRDGGTSRGASDSRSGSRSGGRSGGDARGLC